MFFWIFLLCSDGCDSNCNLCETLGCALRSNFAVFPQEITEMWSRGLIAKTCPNESLNCSTLPRKSWGISYCLWPCSTSFVAFTDLQVYPFINSPNFCRNCSSGQWVLKLRESTNIGERQCCGVFSNVNIGKNCDYYINSWKKLFSLYL